MQAIQFLEKYGRLVNKADELKPGDICGEVGVHTEGDVRLYYVANVVLVPWPSFLSPRVHFKPAHVGVVVDNEFKRYYIHVPMSGESYRFSWAEADDSFHVGEHFSLYIIEDEGYKNLGSLIKYV